MKLCLIALAYALLACSHQPHVAGPTIVTTPAYPTSGLVVLINGDNCHEAKSQPVDGFLVSLVCSIPERNDYVGVILGIDDWAVLRKPGG